MEEGFQRQSFTEASEKFYSATTFLCGSTQSLKASYPDFLRCLTPSATWWSYSYALGPVPLGVCEAKCVEEHELDSS